MKKIHIRNRVLGLLLSVFVLGTYFGVYAINTILTGYRVNVGVTTGIDGWNQSDCRKITNNGVADIFLPTKTTPERNSFLSNVPNDISVDNGIGVCGQSPYQCIKGSSINHGGCQGAPATRKCSDVCNVITQMDTTCTSQDQC